MRATTLSCIVWNTIFFSLLEQLSRYSTLRLETSFFISAQWHMIWLICACAAGLNIAETENRVRLNIKNMLKKYLINYIISYLSHYKRGKNSPLFLLAIRCLLCPRKDVSVISCIFTSVSRSIIRVDEYCNSTS